MPADVAPADHLLRRIQREELDTTSFAVRGDELPYAIERRGFKEHETPGRACVAVTEPEDHLRWVPIRVQQHTRPRPFATTARSEVCRGRPTQTPWLPRWPRTSAARSGARLPAPESRSFLLRSAVSRRT